MQWLKNHLDEDAAQWHKLWSVRIALFWGAFSGLWVAVPAFQSFLDPFVFACICVGMSLAICVARLTNQPGLT
jgi:hypothetical protein